MKFLTKFQLQNNRQSPIIQLTAADLEMMSPHLNKKTILASRRLSIIKQPVRDTRTNQKVEALLLATERSNGGPFKKADPPQLKL